MFALAIVPIIGLVGAAVDYSRGNAARTAMQASLDATALMLSRDAAGMDPDADLRQGDVVLQRAVQPARGRQRPGHRRADQSAAGQLHPRRERRAATCRPTFTRMLGQEKLDICSSAQVKWGVKKLELALVLDNTGSMANNGKMTQLKTASHNLLTTLQNAAKQLGDVKVAIIPFDKIVNIGTGLRAQSWIDYSVHNIQQASGRAACRIATSPTTRMDTTPTSDIAHQISGACTARQSPPSCR